MKFGLLFEDILSDMAMDEARGASDVGFDKFAKTAGSEIANICNHLVTRIYAMPGIASFQDYVNGIPNVDPKDPVSLVLSVEKYYDSWINSLDKKTSDKIHRETRAFIAKYKEKGTAGRPAGVKNKPKDNLDKAIQGLDYTPSEPEFSAEPKRGRGRPKLPPELKKVYIPKKKRVDVPAEEEMTMAQMVAQFKAMQAELAALKAKVEQKDGTSEPSELAESNRLHESLQELKKQYMRFL